MKRPKNPYAGKRDPILSLDEQGVAHEAWDEGFRAALKWLAALGETR